jgi:Fic family protein
LELGAADWPQFSWKLKDLEALEARFQGESGWLLGAFEHLGAEDQNQLIIELISNEALHTSVIEGEVLDRSSVQASVRRQFGLEAARGKTRPAEQGLPR